MIRDCDPDKVIGSGGEVNRIVGESLTTQTMVPGRRPVGTRVGELTIKVRVCTRMNSLLQLGFGQRAVEVIAI